MIFASYSIYTNPKHLPKEPIIIPPTTEYKVTIAGIGVVEPKSELIKLSTEIPGLVSQINVNKNDYVKAGDVLFLIDERDINARINTIEAQLKSAEINEKNAAEQFNSINSITDKRAIAKDDYNNRKYNSQLAKSKIEEIKMQLEQAKVTKDKLQVKAPIDGKILEVNIRLGEYATSADGKLIVMGDVSKLYVRVEIDEEELSTFNPHSKAEGVLRSNPQDRIPLEFVYFEPHVQPKINLAVSGQRVDTRVLQVVYALPNKKREIYVGQQMDVFIDDQEGGK